MNETARILVVDDEASIRGILNELLSSSGYEAAESPSAEDALSRLTAEPFDLVLSDIRMSGLSGIQLLQSIKGLQLGPEVIIMTSNASLSTAMEAIRFGAYDYLLKPFEDLDYVVTVVKRAIERHRLSSENQKLLSSLKEKNEELTRAAQKAAQILAEGRAVHGLIERVLSAAELREAPAQIIETAGRLFRVKSAGLWLPDPQSGDLRPAGRYNLVADQMITIRLPSSDGSGFTGKLDHWFEKGKHREALEEIQKRWGGDSVCDRPLRMQGEGFGWVVWSEPDGVPAARNTESIDTFFMIATHRLKSLTTSPEPAPAVGRPEAAPEGLHLTDDVTPFYSFDFFQELIGIEIRRSRRYRHRFTVLLVSLTVPKALNGEMKPLLQQIAMQMQSRIRSTDLATRYGQKFFLAMPETEIDDAQKMKDRLDGILSAYRQQYRADPIRSKLAWQIALVEYPKHADTLEGLITGLETMTAQSLK